MNFSPHGKPDTRLCVASGLKWRFWNGVVADVWEAQCNPDAKGYYASPDPRLFVVLEMNDGGSFEAQDTTTGEIAIHQSAKSMTYVPAGVAIPGQPETTAFLKSVL